MSLSPNDTTSTDDNTFLTPILPDTTAYKSHAVHSKTVKRPRGGAPVILNTLDSLLEFFYESQLFKKNKQRSHELEIRFGTTQRVPMTRTEYDNVIQTLKSTGFTTTNHFGTPSLRIRSEQLNSTRGTIQMSPVRTEIYGLPNIESYCRANNLRGFYNIGSDDDRVVFLHKTSFINPFTQEKQPPISVDDFHFRASLQVEERASLTTESKILETWTQSKKEFRYVNRVSFTHPDYPVSIDLSITKTGTKKRTERGGWTIIPTRTVTESNVFNNAETYEIEIEIDNERLLRESRWTTETFVTAVKKTIKFVLSGIQKTMYPISYPEQDSVLEEYMQTVWGKEYDPKRHSRVSSRNFLGPNSVTLQRPNIAPISENTRVSNVRADFVVTEKADGERHLLFVSKNGRVYMLSTSMDVRFTGVVTKSTELRKIIIDGELITHDKENRHLNLFAAFDIYVYQGDDVRGLPLMTSDESSKTRYAFLVEFKKSRKWVSVLNTPNQPVDAPLKFSVKQFYPRDPTQSIFEGCRRVLEKTFEYNTDGLIFTHRTFGVGSNSNGKTGPKIKITWDNSFKWKPPEFNTIDFLVTFKKDAQGGDVVRPIFESGVVMNEATQFNEYKVLELRCGFNEKTDGFINPCQSIIDGSHENQSSYDDEYMPRQFYPTEPSDPNAGICHLMMKPDDGGISQLFSHEGDVITDNTIVEFAYDVDKPSFWNWVPLRVRFDKTARLRRGEKEYGNSYKVCNENWRSIHPSGRISEEMLRTGEGIPNVEIAEDVYYNTPAGEMQTIGLKNFHNLYVKKRLINGASRPGDTLIDFACGKAGDLPKWVTSQLSFVFGIDYSLDNIENRLDGACARYLKMKKTTKRMPHALFVQGDSSMTIRNGSAMSSEKTKLITNVIFGNTPGNKSGLGKGVIQHANIGSSGFAVSSCQFAIHYFFRNPETLVGFLRNVATCTQLNGYFIGTTYDGERVFRKLARVGLNQSVQISHNGKKIWEVIKRYDATQIPVASGSLGMRISVFQESINQYIDEYLVYFPYFVRMMENFGLVPASNDDASHMKLPASIEGFHKLFDTMIQETTQNANHISNYGKAVMMSEAEKEVSFLNNYFVFKKIREVDVDSVVVDTSEFDAMNETNKSFGPFDTPQVVFNVKPTRRKIRFAKSGFDAMYDINVLEH